MGVNAWPVQDVADYLEKHGARITIRGGQTLIDFPEYHESERAAVTKNILPHLVIRKAELLVYLGDVFPGLAYSVADSFAGNVQVAHSPVFARRRIISEHVSRAASLGKIVLYMSRPHGLVVSSQKDFVKHYTRPRPYTIRIPLARHATHCCIEGERVWANLPKVTTREEDEAMTPKLNKGYSGHSARLFPPQRKKPNQGNLFE